MTEDRDFEFDYDLFERLTEARGVPGYEDRIREIVREELEAHVDELRSDAMGNVVGTIEADGDYSVAVAAHMDEIGFMVRHVTDEGFVELDALGGWDPRVLRAQRVTIHTEDGDLTGVIGSIPPHTLDEEDIEETQEVEDVRVDLGLPAETVEERVSPGDLVTMDQTTEVVGDLLTGKSLDDRVSVFTMIEAARRIDDPDVTIHFAATAQEEVGLRGARALGVDLDPDLAIALDVTLANDVPGFEEGEYVTELGEGTAVKLKDSSVITNPKVTGVSGGSPANTTSPTRRRSSRGAAPTRPASRTPSAPNPSAPSRSPPDISTRSPRAPTTTTSRRPSTCWWRSWRAKPATTTTRSEIGVGSGAGRGPGPRAGRARIKVFSTVGFSEAGMDDSDSATTSRRDFLRVAGGGAVAAGAAGAAGTASAQDSEFDYGGWFGDVGNFDGTQDMTGEDSVTIDVGINANGGPFGFGPAAVHVDPGTEITFNWVSPGHNVVVESQPSGADWEAHEPLENTGFSFSSTLETEGIYTYFCEPHLGNGMKGAIVVGQPPEPTEAPAVITDEIKTLVIAILTAMASTMGLAYFFIKYGGDADPSVE